MMPTALEKPRYCVERIRLVAKWICRDVIFTELLRLSGRGWVSEMPITLTVSHGVEAGGL